MSETLLNRQIEKYLTAEHLSDSGVLGFINAIRSSYASFERDRELMNHAFLLSEEEFKEVNKNLQNEYELKKFSISKLKQTLIDLDPESKVHSSNDDELVEISSYLNKQIKKRIDLETNLTNTLNLLKTLLSNLNSGIVVEDEHRNLLYANESFCELFNLNTEPEALTGQDCCAMARECASYFVNENDFLNKLDDIIANKKRIINEKLLLKDGRTIERDFVPIWVGELYMGNLWSYTDISEQIKAQAALAESEEQYRTIIERSSDIIYRTNSKGYFNYFNKVAERVTGYSSEELFKMHFSDLIKTSHKKDVLKFYRDQVVNRKQQTYHEFPIITKSGQEKWIGQTVQLSELSANSYEFTSFTVDITERRSYERKILLQEEKYRNIIANMQLGLMEVDNNDVIKFVNNGFCNISGFTEKELLGKKAAETLLVGPGKEIIEQKTKERVLGVSDMYEVPVKDKFGESKWWLVSGGPNYNDDGELIGSIGIHLDITEKKKLEEELNIQRKKAEDSSKAKESFLANMSHEIRTPLNGIIGMIRELSLEELSAKQQKYVSNASVASQHLLSVLNNILDISKIEAGELKLDSNPFSLRETIKDVKSIMSIKAREKGVFFGINVRDIKNNYYLGDSARLRQILLNLIGNSIKFTDKGGVFLECMIIETNEHDQKILITIEDTGIGMDKKYLDNLFTKFSQEDLSISRKYGGTGLGMVITRELVSLMQGTIKVRSVRNEGTTVEITLVLPFASDFKIINSEESYSNKDISNTRVLIVEDNEFNRAVAYNTLKRNGCIITEARDGQEAIKFIQDGNVFDIILMDLQMPLMDGFTATKFLINEYKLKTPIIALSANAFKSEIDACMQIGMKDYVTKPFDEKTLISTIINNVKKSVSVKEKLDLPIVTEKPNGNKLYDLKVLEDISGGDKQFMQRMIEIFIEDSQESIKIIKEALNERNLDTIYRISHKIKPMIDSLGIYGLKNEVRELERLSKNGIDSVYIDQLIESVDVGICQVVEEMKGLLLNKSN
jgi:PAS domain S-box-containing protein